MLYTVTGVDREKRCVALTPLYGKRVAIVCLQDRDARLLQIGDGLAGDLPDSGGRTALRIVGANAGKVDVSVIAVVDGDAQAVEFLKRL